jgi:hypothetical protein
MSEGPGLSRRGFLRGVAALAVVSTAPEIAQAKPKELPISDKILENINLPSEDIAKILQDSGKRLSYLRGEQGLDVGNNLNNTGLVSLVKKEINNFQPKFLPGNVWQNLKDFCIGIMIQESRFNPNTQSSNKGAVGLCQITQIALDDLSVNFQITTPHLSKLTDPVLSTKTMLEIFDKSLYAQVGKRAEFLAKGFGLNEEESVLFTTMCLINAYNAGGGTIFTLIKGLNYANQNPIQFPKFSKEIAWVKNTRKATFLFDLLRAFGAATYKTLGHSYGEDAQSYVQNVLAAAIFASEKTKA